MLTSILTVVQIGLIVASVFLGLASPIFAFRRMTWLSLGFWGFGLLAGKAGILLSFKTEQMRDADYNAKVAAGLAQQFHNDMPGYGQALAAYFGSIYFAFLLLLILLILAIDLFRNGHR